MTWTVDEPAQKRRWFVHPWVIALLVIGVALAGWGVSRVPRIFDDGMRGPYGRFPQPVAAEPPLHSAQQVASSARGYGRLVVYGGLAINGGFGGGVRAVSIATGKTYWRYGKNSAPIGMDREAGGVLVQGNGLIEINVRSGRIRWSRPDPDVGNGQEAVVPEAATKTLLVLGDQGIAGVDRASGGTRWTQRWPAECLNRITAVVTGTIAVACQQGNVSDDVVLGFDVATGTRRWDLRAPQLFPEIHSTSDHRIGISGVWESQGRLAVETEGSLDLLDPATGETLIHRARTQETPVGFSGGIQISTCLLGKKTAAICGSDANTGKRLWSSPVPGHGGFGGSLDDEDSVAIADGRVYSLSFFQRAQKRIMQMAVLDLRTGKVFGQMPLTIDGADGFHGPITDGVITLGYGLNEFLYAERPDLRGTRKLFP
jgi:outer membrane protein assembly factor BamB